MVHMVAQFGLRALQLPMISQRVAVCNEVKREHPRYIHISGQQYDRMNTFGAATRGQEPTGDPQRSVHSPYNSHRLSLLSFYPYLH